MERPIPPRLVLKQFAATSWMPLIGFFPLVILLFIYIGMSAAGSASLEEWSVPLLGLSLTAGVAFISTGLFSIVTRWRDIRTIKRVYNEVWAVFPQYKSEEQWQRFIENDRNRGLKNHHFEWVGLLIVTVVVVIIGIAWLASDAETEMVFALAGFEAIVAAIITGRWLRGKWDISARYKRRLQMPSPNVIISKDGHYHEDEGFDSLRLLKSIAWKDATKARPAKIIFTARIPFLETLTHSETAYVPRLYQVEVKILKDQESAAKALIERFQNERLVK